MKRLTAVVTGPPVETATLVYTRVPGEAPVKVRRVGGKVRVEFPADLSDASVLHGLERYLEDRGA